MLLDELERADSQCESLLGYVDRYHEADKRAAILEERIRTNRSVEVAFGVGVGLGGMIVGLAPSFWDNLARGLITLAVGALLIIGGVAVRIVKR